MNIDAFLIPKRNTLKILNQVIPGAALSCVGVLDVVQPDQR